MSKSEDSIPLAVRLILRPVIGFCLRRSVKIQQLLEEAKRIYIDLATDELERENITASTSRLAVMTGLHRRDVERLKTPQQSTVAAERGVSLLTRVIGQWKSDSRFCTKNGKPRVLSLSGGEGEFVELLTAVSKELNPYTLLFELERLGYAERVEEGVKLLTSGVVPKRDVEQSYKILSRDLEHFVSAVESNTFEAEKDPHLHLTTVYDNVPPALLPQVRQWFLKEGAAIHKRARAYLSRFDRDLNASHRKLSGKATISLTTFSFNEVTEKEGESEDE